MSKPTIELLHIPYSPWSEKARWALEARGVPYQSRWYQPLLGEPELRVRLKRWRGPVSVPVLFTPRGPIADSLAIARFADGEGTTGAALFPIGSDAAIARFNALSERGLAAGRARSLARVLADDDALREMLPKPLRAPLGAVGVKIAAGGVRRTLEKYGATRHSDADHLATLQSVLGELRVALGGGDHLIGDALSYADIAAAQVLGFVTPPERGLRIGRHNRAAFTDGALAAEFADLVAWRDALYARHRA